VKPFILVTDQGTIFTWDQTLKAIFLRRRRLESQQCWRNAVYKGVAILNSSLTQPALAVTDFHGGFIDTFIPDCPSGASGFVYDPNLPLEFAPFAFKSLEDKLSNIRGARCRQDTIGDWSRKWHRQHFRYGWPIHQRFATGGALNAPWGIAQASANFGPFQQRHSDWQHRRWIINAFDPASGRLVGKLTDATARQTDVGLHGLAFRSDGLRTPTPVFASEFSSERDGLFGAITTRPGQRDQSIRS